MIEDRKVPMPEDWNDHAGWDNYWQSQLEDRERAAMEDRIGSIGIDDLPQLANELKSHGWRTVWVPGCGLSPLARLLAHLGLQAVATDVSPAAIEFQRSEVDEFPHLTAELGPAVPGGSLTAELHDFRTEFHRDAFDLVINVKAFQCFPMEDMVRISRVHADSLRKGRYGYFDTLNVQGEQRDQLEQALEDGGFVVPFIALNRWYRRALDETGIPYIFILGHPMTPRTGEYADGGPNWDRDMARLRDIGNEYTERLSAEQEAEEQRIGPDAKVAQVIYSTG